MKIINYEKKMIPLTKEEKRYYKKKHVIYVKKSFVMVKQLNTNLILLIVLDLWQLHYQNFLIICLEILKA